MDISEHLGRLSPSNLSIHTRRDSFRVPPKLSPPSSNNNRGRGMYFRQSGVRDPRLAGQWKASESTDQSARGTTTDVPCAVLQARKTSLCYVQESTASCWQASHCRQTSFSRVTRGATYPLCATASTDGSYVYPRNVGAETWHPLIKMPCTEYVLESCRLEQIS